MKRTIIQIATIEDRYLFAVASDGTLWRYSWHKEDWEQMPDLPQPAPSSEGPESIALQREVLGYVRHKP
jgi:hypothetical protein